MTVSIIITCKGSSKYLEESLRHCKDLDYPDYEIIVLPDEEFSLQDLKVKVIPTGSVLPAQKRDMSLKYAKGDILAFIDDDAYPQRDWLKNSVRHFDNLDIAAVCGPAVTPADDNTLQKASGLVYSSLLVSGSHRRRYVPSGLSFVDDYPSCNFIMRKEAFKEIGGFDTTFWPGEDTILCLKIVKDLKKKIIYDPKALVYHHRRALFREHSAQIANYALHRGFFVKRFPETSFRLAYFAPSFLIFWLILAGVASLFNIHLRNFYLATLVFYLFSVLLFSVNKDLKYIPTVFKGIILTHITYGIYFLKGFLSPSLREEKL